MFEEGNILDWNLSNFISVGLIGATWLAIFAMGRKILMNGQSSGSGSSATPNTVTGAGNVVQFNPSLNQGVSYG
jgi:hypothetical protein